MSANTKAFEIYGVGFTVSGDETLASWMAEDFSFFEKSESTVSSPRIVFRVTSEPEALPRLFPAFRTRMCRVTGGWWGERVCDYGDGTFVRSWFQEGRREFEIVMGLGESARVLAYEALYSAVLSAVGEELDLRGFHRAHGLGIEIAGKRALLLLPSGGGKSAIAALLCREARVRIYSDESPLLRDSRMFSFPVRGALRPDVARALGLVSGGGAERIFRRKLFPEKLLYRFDRAKVAEPAHARLDFGRIQEWKEGGHDCAFFICKTRCVCSASGFLCGRARAGADVGVHGSR